MFGPDPIDIFDPSPYNPLAYYGHYLVGSVVLLAALVALAVTKGRGTHRTAGLIFVIGTFILSLTTISKLAERLIPPLMVAVVTSLHAIGGAYLALQPGSARVRMGEYLLAALQVIGLVGFLMIAIPEVRAGVIPPFAPMVILVIPLILLAGDANWFFRSAERRKHRVARHLSRMIWGFVVVLRAPLVEIAAAGVPIPPAAIIFGPILLALAMLWYFQRNYGGFPFGRSAHTRP